MLVKDWSRLPAGMRVPEVKPYYDLLRSRRASLILKRMGDIAGSGILLILLSPVFLVLSIWIKVDSPGPVFFRQTRITQYGKPFRIFKFRTMVNNADRIGTQVTVQGDSRITKVGAVIRKYRLDEISQLIDVFRGTMTFVGTRPEVSKYVEQYAPEMMATLLLPAGVTSTASIQYKDEDELLSSANDVDAIYVSEILPAKMKYNLADIRDFSVGRDVRIMLDTVKAVAGR